ncbi:MAG: AAA family ATPase [Geobacteraceae bacterium]|nr:AAA family ATPase [Geobacteraceae bacterium]
MKILRLTFKNLNSLAGVWDIDFRHPDYVSSGIFAITGPTGAGKSTILDAICLALYGQTPRLGRISQGENEIMSRQTGECFAEVEFETARGRFRCHWSQHRSRKQADGQLQSPRHEISDAASMMILESKLRGVIEKVEDVTGMDFDRFTRSMLLAQGGFAAFLQARPDERAPILEQITGTAIYSRISIKVHERTSEERKRLSELRAELDGIRLLSPGEAEALLLEQSTLQRSEAALAADARLIGEARAWRERITALETELLQLEQERIALDARKAAAAPELERLELAGRALKLGGGHARIGLVRAQQEAERGELVTATELVPQRQLDCQAAFEALELAGTGLAGARSEQAREAEMIRRTRELDVRLGELQGGLQRLEDEIEKGRRQAGDYRSQIRECEARIDQNDGQLREAAAFLAEHSADAGLAGSLAGIEQQLKSLQSLDRQCRETGDRLAGQAALIDDATVALGRAENAWLESQRAVAGAESGLAGIVAARSALLQGRELSAWRSDAETLANRLSRLESLTEVVARIEGQRSKLAELQPRLESLELQRLELVRQEAALAGESELRERVVRGLQDNLVLINRVCSLEEDRRRLEDGVPCPLCGSPEHPYAAGNIPQPDQARQELESALAESRAVNERLSRIRAEQVALDRELQRSGQELEELRQRQLHDESLCTNAMAELGLAAEPGEAAAAEQWTRAIRSGSGACRGELLRLRSVIEEGEQLEQQERDALAALARLKGELAGHDQAHLAARLGQEAAHSERTRLEAESVELQAGLVRVRVELDSVVAVYGCGEIDPDGAGRLLADLGGRRDRYLQRMQAHERLEKERADFAAGREKLLALLAESEKMLAERELELNGRVAQRDALVEQRLELYGERNPDQEEKRLADALRQADELREAALKRHNLLQAELEGLKAQIERLTRSISGRGDELSRMESEFLQHLAEAGFADEGAFLQACLPQERFEQLTKMAASLGRDEAAFMARLKDRREALAAELEKNLTDKALELILEEQASVTGRLVELQKELGALELKLRQHAEQQRLHHSRLQAIERQQRECGRWERLHSLIGSGDGKKFRNFAQGLTFELMVAHANRQLQKMSDRYILVRDGGEPLELNVIDNYQAGEVRSTKNLSGGESFIASLALSLGLSNMSSRNVRVDSLFLDEGFGTLDEDALETALETLSGLQQDGKLIGIISHVPALKERIGTQLQVEAGSGGRSSLSGPGCRRVS